MMELGWKRIKVLWDEFRESKQVRHGWWWLVSEPEPPWWFLHYELGLDEGDGGR